MTCLTPSQASQTQKTCDQGSREINVVTTPQPVRAGPASLRQGVTRSHEVIRITGHVCAGLPNYTKVDTVATDSHDLMSSCC